MRVRSGATPVSCTGYVYKIHRVRVRSGATPVSCISYAYKECSWHSKGEKKPNSLIPAHAILHTPQTPSVKAQHKESMLGPNFIGSLPKISVFLYGLKDMYIFHLTLRQVGVILYKPLIYFTCGFWAGS